jgi:hypothetical protein
MLSRVTLTPEGIPLSTLSHLGSEFVVPLHKLVIVFGPMGDSIVHLEHAGMAWLEDGHEALHHSAAEGFAVHPLPKVQLFCGDLAMQAVPKIAVIEEVLSEDELTEFNLFTS